MLSVESMRDILFPGVQMVENNVSIGSTAGSEDNDLSELRKLLQKFFAKRTNPHSSLSKKEPTARVPPLSRGKLSFTE